MTVLDPDCVKRKQNPGTKNSTSQNGRHVTFLSSGGAGCGTRLVPKISVDYSLMALIERRFLTIEYEITLHTIDLFKIFRPNY